MKDAKRGKLRSVTTRPMYDEKQNISGYTVSADHDADDSGSKDGGSRYLPPVETPHESMESATAKHGEHLATNATRFGGGKKKAMDMDEEPMRAAMGRKR